MILRLGFPKDKEFYMMKKRNYPNPCLDHGYGSTFPYQEKFKMNCDGCFNYMKGAINRYFEIHKEQNQEVADLKYDNERLRKFIAEKI